MTSAIFAFIHHILAFVLVAALAVEFVLIRQPLNEAAIRKLLITDAIYGVSAVLLFFIGFSRVYNFEKGAAYYFSSSTFNLKFAVFIAVAVISLYQTRTFFRWRSSLKSEGFLSQATIQQRRIRRLIGIELAGLVVIVFCAALMARGL